jgi:hypothetical protein
MVAHDLVEVAGGKLRLHFHPGQWRAWQSERRFVVVLAGTQSGKTSFGPHWLYREIQRCGPGDYLVVTPTFTLLELKCLPEFRRIFETVLRLGRYVSSPVRKFTFSDSGSQRTFGERHDPTKSATVFFGYAEDPDSLESATAKAAWLDEAGQKKFKLGSWEAVLRRLSLAEGRVLITTTIYNLGWLKQRLWDRWQGGDANVDVVSFSSLENPAFPRTEFERARKDLPGWKFDMFYRALFTRPAGLIYDCFDEDLHECPRFAIPTDWRRFLGLDFGGVNTAAVFYAEDPADHKLYLYREYLAGSRTAKEHATELRKGEPGIPFCVGGSHSEGQWRDEFRAGGLPVREPAISDVEVGLDRVYGAHRDGQIVVFDDCHGYLDQKLSYSHVVDDASGEPTAEIEDKADYHFMDAERYIIGWLRQRTEPASATAQVPLDAYKTQGRRSRWQR